MLSITLEPQYEQEWQGDSPSKATFPPCEGKRPLYHQIRTYRSEKPLIINTYNTGTGKTKAALLRLLKRARDIGGVNYAYLDKETDNVLLIAPTNELLNQHAEDAEQFCEENHLPYRVLILSRAKLDEYMSDPHFSEAHLRRGASLHYILDNPRRIDDDRNKKATLIVVNPDIFYYALYFRYHRLDGWPLFRNFLTLFNYIIIDEFHYYNPKQLANFLFFMSLSKHMGYIEGSTKRQFCILTATPNPDVQTYLDRLGIDSELIAPENAPNETALTKEVQALSQVHLEVYSADELKENDVNGGLLTLVTNKRQQILQWLNKNEDGAIISGELWRVNQIYNRLTLGSAFFNNVTGRLTGAEDTEGRSIAKVKPLILATPTVDIGYNFGKKGKLSQNIDFLLFDARSSDEFIQRLGRAGRVLGKPNKDKASQVLAVVDPDFYKALEPFDQQHLSRTDLRPLAETHLPPRNALYSYIESGAIAEAFLPIYRLGGMESTEDRADHEALFTQVRDLFAEKSTVTYSDLERDIRPFIYRDKQYNQLVQFPTETFEKLAWQIGHAGTDRGQEEQASLSPTITACLKACGSRYQDERTYRISRHKPLWKSREAVYDWLIDDLRRYFTQKARFSFREYFQPPLALVSDSKHLLSSKDMTPYDALHIVRYYKADYFGMLNDWCDQLRLPQPIDTNGALIYCDLKDLREPGQHLRIGLSLQAREYAQVDWQELFAFRPTALYGLTIEPLNDSHGLSYEVQRLFQERFVPAFVVPKESFCAGDIRRLQRRARFFPYELSIVFNSGQSVEYLAILGTMALQIHTEIPRRSIAIDRNKAYAADDRPMIY